MPNIKLIKIIKSPKKGKKYRAIFMKNNREKVTDFGAIGYSDYTKHKDRERRNRYIFRHLKDTKTFDPSRAGFLSLFILWNKTSFRASVQDYKRRLSAYNKSGKFNKKITGYVPPNKLRTKSRARR